AHSVAERQVRRARVESHLQAQRAPRCHRPHKLVAQNDVGNSALRNPAQLFAGGDTRGPACHSEPSPQLPFFWCWDPKAAIMFAIESEESGRLVPSKPHLPGAEAAGLIFSLLIPCRTTRVSPPCP